MGNDFSIYVCPRCKGQLVLEDEMLHCWVCQVAYPIVNGIPDFILEEPVQKTDWHFWRANKYYDRHAHTYELTRYPLRLILYGGFEAPSFKELMRITAEFAEIDEGLILDAACGPGTLGRRVASPSKAIYGVDLSMGMLRQGTAYVKRDHSPNVYFARAQVESLPFRDAQFDAALCGAALKLFFDPLLALCEIGRAMKAGAPLAASTIIGGNKGFFRYRCFRKYARWRGLHVFRISEIEEYLARAGFEDLQFQVYGSMVLFRAHKRRI